MKRSIMLGMICTLVFGVLSAGESNAGCANCPTGKVASGQSDQARTFQRNTMDLRQEMMNKRFELQRENLQAVPDSTKMTALNSDISALQAKIHAERLKSGLECKNDGDCGQMMDCGCGKKAGKGNCNIPVGK